MSRNLDKNPLITEITHCDLVLVMKAQAGCKTALAFILIFFFCSLFSSELITFSRAEATETVMWIVDDDDSAADFSSIQAAIDGAEFGDTVYVRSGHYYEHVLINKQVKLIGENETSIIDGNFAGDVVTVAANNVEISSFTIQNSGKRIVTDEFPPPFEPVYENMCGIHVKGCSGSNISGNIINNNFIGLCFESCSSFLISKNKIMNSYGDCGIKIAFSSSVTLFKNKITLNNICGAVIRHSSGITVSDNQIVENLQSGMVISSSRFVTVLKNNITGNAYHGLNLVCAYENSVLENNMSSNYHGICLSGSNNNQVYENYLHANYYAVAFYDSPKEQAYNNVLINNANDVYTFVSNTSSGGSDPFFSPAPSESPKTTAPDSHENIKILSPTSGLYQIGLYEAVEEIPLRFIVNKPVSWMAYSLDNKANVTITGNTTVTISFTGSHSIVVYAKDTDGDASSSDFVTFKVASTPSVSINSPKNDTIYTANNIPVNITAFAPITGIEYIEYRVVGKNYSGAIKGTQLFGHETEGIVVLSELPSGNYTLIVVAHAWFTGAVGNSTAYFTVSISEPSASPSQSYSKSQALVSSLDQSSNSFSFQQFSYNNPLISMSLSTKEYRSTIFLMFIIAVIGISLLVYFKKRTR